MRRIALAGLALAFTIGGASAASAQDTAQARRPRAERELRARRGPGNPGQALLRDIQLSDRQKEQIKAIFEKHRPSPEEIQKVREHRRELRARAREQRETGEPRDTAEMRRVRQQATHRAMQDRTELQREIRAILTPDQQAQFDRNVQEMKKRMEERMERRRENRRQRP